MLRTMFERVFELRERRLLPAMVAVCLGLGGCGGGESPEQGGGEAEGGQGGPPPALVRLGEVRHEEVRQRRLVTGQLQAVRQSTVAAQESGRVIQAPPDVGAEVSEGQMLARMDRSLLLRDKVIAEAKVREAEAAVEEVKATLEQARADRRRLEGLLETGGVTEAEYDLAVREERVAEARLVTARATIASEQAALGRVEERLERMQVYAPFDGSITEKHAELGEWLSPGSPVVILTATDILDAVIDVPEHMIDELNRDAPVTLTVSGIDRTVSGPVHNVVPRANPRARTFPVHVRLDNTDRALRPGMSVRCELPTGKMINAITVHRNAVQMTPQGPQVIASRDGTGAPVPVHILFRVGERFAVDAALEPGEKVVIEGNERVQPGQPLQIKQAEQPSDEQADPPARPSPSARGPTTRPTPAVEGGA